MKTMNPSKTCSVEECDRDSFGMFPECREHFQERNRGGQKKFKWTPASACFLTITTILNNYPELFSHNIKEDQLNERHNSKITFIHIPCGKETTLALKVLINGRVCGTCIKQTRLLEEPDEELICEVDGCKTSKHSLFNLCKTHFVKKHAPGGKFRWVPESVCRKTIESILDCYNDVLEYTIDLTTLDKGRNALVKIKHLACGYVWTARIVSLVGVGSGCQPCSTNWWTYEYVMEQLKERTDLIADEIEQTRYVGAHTKVWFTCIDCGYRWNPTIQSVINEKIKCLSCQGILRWTLARLKSNNEKMGRDDIIFLDEVDPIKNNLSKVHLQCKYCLNEWYQAVGTLSRTGGYCRSCNGTVQYTYQRLILALEFRKDVNTRLIRPEHVKNSESKIPLICVECDYEWCPRIADVIHKSSGCPNCANNRPLNWQRFLDRFKVHTDLRLGGDFEANDNIRVHHRIPVVCIVCDYSWKPLVSNLLNRGARCPRCFISKGVGCISTFLMKEAIVFDTEKAFPGLVYKKSLRIDIYIDKIEGIKFPVCIEYDGNYPGSHFNFSNTEEYLAHRKMVICDNIKNSWLIEHGMHLLRIPYTLMKGFKQEKTNEIMDKALVFLAGCSEPTLYLADEEPYRQRDLRNDDCKEEE